jgi:alkaline phosphatase
MAQTALEALYTASAFSEKGFFLLIEGSRIDMASHSNDPVGHVHDVLAFNDAFHVTRKFIERVGGVLISTSDHETGGLSVGRQINSSYPEYIWYPQVLANASHSTEYLGYQIEKYIGTSHVWVNVGNDLREFIEKNIVQDGLGIHDATHHEIETLISYKSSAVLADYTLADMISRRAQIGVCL